MKLTPEQNAAVASWIAAGDNLSVVQKKLAEQFQLTLTYMDVRFLVDDLDLTLKDPAPAPDAQPDLTKTAPEQPDQEQRRTAHTRTANPFDADDLDDNDTPHAQHPSPPSAMPRENEAYDEDDTMPPQAPEAANDAADAADAAPTNIRVEVDNVTLIPGALASGSVTFTDGVTGKWMVDQYGRPGFTQISQQGYRPAPADAQAFMQELGVALRKKGF
jgi:hypothetical protein